MAISIGQRDEDIEGIPRQREEIVRFRAFTAESRHRAIIAVFAIADNGIVLLTARAIGKDICRLGPANVTKYSVLPFAEVMANAFIHRAVGPDACRGREAVARKP